MKRSYMKQRRDTPRRTVNPTPMPGALEQNRVKDTKARPMNAEEKRHADRLTAMGCLICVAPAEYHHETGSPRHAKSHKHGAPLCPTGHHREGPESRHKLGLPDFDAMFAHIIPQGLDVWCSEQWAISQQLERTAA